MRTPVHMRPGARSAAPRPAQGAASSNPFDIMTVMKMVESLTQMHQNTQKMISSFEEKHKNIDLIKKGEPGRPGAAARVDHELIVNELAKRIKIKQPQNGKSPSAQSVAEVLMPKLLALLPHGPQQLNMNDVVEQIFTMIETGKKKLKLENIDGLDSKFAEVRSAAALSGAEIYGQNTWKRGGGDTVVAGAGVTIVETGNGTKQISAGGASVLMFAIPSGTIGGGNTTFTVRGTVVIAFADDGNDPAASTKYNSTTGLTTIVYSVPPQNNVSAFVLASSNPTLLIPAGAVNNSNTTYTIAGRVTVDFTDRIVDVGAIFAYNALTNTTTITASVPPQNDISALVVAGFPITTQTPTCTTNETGNPDGVQVLFSAVGQINAAVGDSGIDSAAILAYNYATNVTIITYSVPPQNNVSTF